MSVRVGNTLMAFVLASGAIGCGMETEESAGAIRLPLTASAVSGNTATYRIRNATFQVRGPKNTSISSEAYASDLTSIEIPVPAGSYQVELSGGWTMEYSTASQPWTTIAATLKSPSLLTVAVASKQTTNAVFQFQVDRTLLNFGDGTLGVGISVSEVGGRCAAHTVEVPASEVPSCSGGGSVGSSPILDTYGCTGEANYPSASSCPAGTTMASYWGYLGGTSYICYVGQSIGATTPPAGCPITNTTCAAGFVYDSAGSRLSWTGGSSAWGCFLACKADPDPTVTNPDWPCTQTGYRPIGGSSSVCCANY